MDNNTAEELRLAEEQELAALIGKRGMTPEEESRYVDLVHKYYIDVEDEDE